MPITWQRFLNGSTIVLEISFLIDFSVLISKFVKNFLHLKQRLKIICIIALENKKNITIFFLFECVVPNFFVLVFRNSLSFISQF